MESARVFLLLIGICCVILVIDANSRVNCCSARERIYFTMAKGRCSEVEAKPFGRKMCKINVCGDGTTESDFCGLTPCNQYGCHCKTGCRLGGFSLSFLRHNEEFGIKVYAKAMLI